MSTESERLAELVTDVGHRLAQAFGDVISPEAQRHLRIAQREALSALFLIYEEQLKHRTGRATPDGGDGDGDGDDRDDWPQDMEEAVRWARTNPGADTPSSRVKKIELD